MRRRRAAAAFVLSLVVVAGIGVWAAGASGRPMTILPLGDSITAGDPGEDGYRAYLPEELARRGVRVRYMGTQRSRAGAHEGWTGYTTEELLPRVDAALATAAPAVVLLHVGTNDLGLGVTPAEAAKNVGRIVDRIFERSRALGAPAPRLLLALVIPRAFDGPGAETLRRYNTLLGELARGCRAAGQPVELVDMHSALSAGTDLADPLHPNEQGYRKMARVWADAIAGRPAPAK